MLCLLTLFRQLKRLRVYQVIIPYMGLFLIGFFIPGLQSKKQESVIHTGQLLYSAKGDKFSNTREETFYLLELSRADSYFLFSESFSPVQKQLTLCLLTALLL